MILLSTFLGSHFLFCAQEAFEMENPTMSMLDKFKRRLVRDIARRLYHEKQAENEMWQQLKEEYGCDCHLLWEHMRALTLKKLKRLLAAEDRLDYITRIARMTSTDWLTFDLVLVHEKVDVIGEELKSAGKPEPAVLTLLFDLVQKYSIESLKHRFLAEAWCKLTQEYNTGGRQCSPMLLQRRWYQLKETTRTKVYDFWQSYRGNPRLFAKACERKPTDLQLKIVEKYRYLITEPFVQWEDLIKKMKIVPPGAFEKRKYMDSNTSSENDPDLIVVEPHVETIEVPADSDSDEADKKNESPNTGTDLTNDAKELTIKAEPTDSSIELEENDAIKNLENISIPIETDKHQLVQGAEDFDTGSANGTEIILPKITSVMGNVVIPEYNLGANIVTDKNAQAIAQKPNDDGDDVQIVSPTPADEYIINIDAVDTKNKVISEDVISMDSVSNFNDLPNDLEFVDDGIELEENEMESQINTPLKEEKGQESSGLTDENDAECKIDPKLIMFPITYTRKVDHMEIFKHTSFVTVKGNDIIMRALAESKPIFNKNVNKEQSDEGRKEEENDDVTKSIPRLKFSCWRLQKPKNRSYNPIQLCKNPDFNTRLKKLTVGFFSSERNRLLYSACNPLTVDLHKAFESSLVDNTLYLESTDSLKIKAEKEIDECENTASVMPSAIAVQSLLDNNKAKVQELLQATEQKPEELTPVNCVVMERNKTVKLPNIEQVRLVNQNLLTAEVSPITLTNNTNNTKPPVKLVNAVSPAPSPLPTSQSNDADKDSIPDNVTHNEMNAKRLLLKRKLAAPKLKQSKTLPPWSVCNKPDTIYESLITKDTLYKMLCMLNGVDIKNIKRKSHYVPVKKKQSINNDESINTETKQSVKKKVNHVQTDALCKNVEKPVDLFEDTPRTVNQNKVKNRKSNRTISSKSTYCCWAQYRLQNKDSKIKLRHLCPKPICKCCCRNLLDIKRLQGSKTFDLTEDPINPDQDNSVENPSTTRQHTSTNSNTLQQSDEFLDRNSDNRSPVRALDSAIDTATDNTTSACSIQSPLSNVIPPSFGSLHNETCTDEAFQVTNAISLTADVSRKAGSSIRKLVTDTTAVNESSLSPNAGVEQTNLRHQQSIKTDTLNNQPDSDAGPISLSDEDEVPSAPENYPTSTNQVLPNGVRLVLLPDNTLSLSLDPDAQLEQKDLEKLPEILSAVQKQLTNSAVIKSSSQNVFTCIVNPYSNLNGPMLNAELNAIQLASTEDNQADVSGIQENIHINNAQPIAFSHISHIENINSDIIYQDSTDNSNSSPFILKSNDNLVESTHSYSFAKINERVIGKDPSYSASENTANESNVAKLNCNRATILSDLMTMSGISQEDAHVSTEEVSSIQITPTPSLSNTNRILNYDISNNTLGSTTQQNVKKNKPIKKIVVSIRKKKDQNVPLLSESIIDLTDECNTTTNYVQENKNENVKVIRKIVNNLKAAPTPIRKVIHPLKFYKPCRPISIKKVSNSLMPFQIIKGNLGTSKGKPLEHLKEVIKKNYIRIVSGKIARNKTARGSVVNVDFDDGVDFDEYPTNKTEQNRESDSDSSDDEPLAKKMMRIRGSSHMTQNNEASIDKVDSLIPVAKYDIPVEFESDPLTKENLAVHDTIEESRHN